jgi:O-antigen ligase
MNGDRSHGRFLPAWGFVAAYAALLLLVPTRLTVGAIGAPGTPANLLAIAGLLWWGCMVVGGLGQVRGLTPMRLALGAFVAATLLSYGAGHLQGWSQPADIHQRSDRLWEAATVHEVTDIVSSAADRGLLALAGWAGILLLTAEGVRTWAQLERLVDWIVRAAALVAAMAVTQYVTGLNIAAHLRIPGLVGLMEFGDALSRSDLNRVVATSAHPIELGVIMAALLPLALHRALRDPRAPAPWVPVVLMGMAALMSVSRSAVLVGGVAAVVLLIGWPMRLRIIALVAAVPLFLAVRLAFPGLLGTIRSLFTGLEGDPSVAGRTDDYPVVLRLIEQRPLHGQGLFTFIPMVYRTVDNQMLVMVLELGLIGTAAFLGLVLTAQVAAWTPRRLGLTAQQQSLGLAVSASLAGIVTSFVTFDALSFRQVAGVTFLLMGLAGAIHHLAGLSATASPSSPSAAAPHAGATHRSA